MRKEGWTSSYGSGIDQSHTFPWGWVYALRILLLYKILRILTITFLTSDKTRQKTSRAAQRKFISKWSNSTRKRKAKPKAWWAVQRLHTLGPSNRIQPGQYELIAPAGWGMTLLAALVLGFYKEKMMPQQIQVTLIPTALLKNGRMHFPAEHFFKLC